MTTPRFLYGLHEEGGEHLFADRKGWITFLAEIGHDPDNHSGRDYSQWTSQGYGVIVRVNNGYGTSGTIPLPEHYRDFAKRFANYVAASPGCYRWQVGNEPNHAQEWPDNQKIDPFHYADCFNQVAAAVHALPGHEKDEVVAAAIAPWNVQAGDWIAYSKEMLGLLRGCNAIGLHAYTHGESPDLITSEVMMRDAPYQDRRGEFRAYQDTLTLGVPGNMKMMKVYLTEMSQIVVRDNKIVGWIDANTGWVQAAYGEIANWNSRIGTQKIMCGCLYRWPDENTGDDVWGLKNRTQIHADLRAAVARGYEVPRLEDDEVETFFPVVGTGGASTTPPVVPLPPVQWDERLTKRGIVLTQYIPKPGEWFWRITKGEYWEEKEHIFAVTLDENGVRKPGVAVRYWWQDGNTDKRTELKPNDRWMTDFDMHAHSCSYGFKVLDGPSDSVYCMGLGSWQQPDWNIHVSYWYEAKWTQAPASSVPKPPSPPTSPPVPRFKMGDNVYTRGYVNLRRTPGYVGKAASDVMGTMEPGSLFEIVVGPHIKDGLVWWQGTSTYGNGFIAESDPQGSVLVSTVPPDTTNDVPILVHPIAEPSLRVMTQPFGVNEHIYKKFLYDGVPLLGHNGVDYGVPEGTPIRAVDAGTVIEQANDVEGYGLYIKIKHAWGETLYAHLSKFARAVGGVVAQSEVIGLSGNTGNSTGPHLHFGIRVNPYRRTDGYGGYENPLAYLTPSPSTKNIKEIAEGAASEFNVDVDLLLNLLYAENRFKLEGTSPKGAIGPAQLMMPTWNEWSGRIGAKNIHNPSDNIRVGAVYLAYLIKYFEGSMIKGLFAYNWGMGNVMSGAAVPVVTQIYAHSIIHGTGIMKAIRKL